MRRIEMKQNLDKSNRIQLFPITPKCRSRLSRHWEFNLSLLGRAPTRGGRGMPWGGTFRGGGTFGEKKE